MRYENNLHPSQVSTTDKMGAYVMTQKTFFITRRTLMLTSVVLSLGLVFLLEMNFRSSGIGII